MDKAIFCKFTRQA